MMERRDFLRNTVVVSAGVLVAPSLFAKGTSNSENHLTILHTNDTHSNIDPFPENHSRYPGKGGVARRFELINKNTCRRRECFTFRMQVIFFKELLTLTGMAAFSKCV